MKENNKMYLFSIRPVHQDSGFLYLMLDQIKSKEDGTIWSSPIPYLLPVTNHKTHDSPDSMYKQHEFW